MSAIVHTLPASPVEPWLASMDALDCSAEIIEAAGDIGAAGNTLFSAPTNRLALADAEAAARKVLAVVGRLRSMAR